MHKLFNSANRNSTLHIRFLIMACYLLMPLMVQAGSVIVSWDANTESDLAGYKIYYGKTSRDYNREVFVGNVTSHKISALQPTERYYFAVTAFDHSGNESGFSQEVSAEIPEGAVDDVDEANAVELGTLVYNYPNPFKVNEETTAIRYEMVAPGNVTIEVFDIDNNLVKTLVKNEFRSAGEHTEDVWDGTNSDRELVANGVYLCRIRTNEEQRFVKISVIR
ncbi:T9SS type A sorting domain-containing protein [candidate division KSB1 bacterium]|nr:T9SS type A sorting domain-containing protein [candidate division KSB1 bacterium]NIR72525.1 T9SS type A sorting domain-containing protein [candidate division KSB1 bacterium]NIS23824.1 T9SS type A sorting domain-containing protein [candidate division KSB1 bacterium]NIT70751.1 T9SS type A sorting domain-containing protein [candidate division KSB1 bacterium]NIU24266.1 T9SS type A sorting domain-containing protein [candidate division KSB1 bacterium]